MEAMDMTVERELVHEYDDGPGWPGITRAKERAYRRGFVEQARRICPDADGRDLMAEAQAAARLRRRVRERYSVYRRGRGRGCAGRRTHHLGYRPGHAVAAARLRGRHHALEYVVQAWPEVRDRLAFTRLVLPAWLLAVERWAAAPISNRIIAPPRPLEVEGAVVATAPAAGVA